MCQDRLMTAISSSPRVSPPFLFTPFAFVCPRVKRHHDIERILEEFKGVRTIPRIKTAKKRVLITKIKNKKGECITSRKGIADTFGEFYKRLYEDSGKNSSEQEESDEKRIPEITSEELQRAICKLKFWQISRRKWNTS